MSYPSNLLSSSCIWSDGSFRGMTEVALDQSLDLLLKGQNLSMEIVNIIKQSYPLHVEMAQVRSLMASIAIWPLQACLIQQLLRH